MELTSKSINTSDLSLEIVAVFKISTKVPESLFPLIFIFKFMVS